MTTPIIAPTADGWELRAGKHAIGQYKSFREAQIGWQQLWGQAEFARRFPTTTATIAAETRDQARRGGRTKAAPSVSCVHCGRLPCRCEALEVA